MYINVVFEFRKDGELFSASICYGDLSHTALATSFILVFDFQIIIKFQKVDVNH